MKFPTQETGWPSWEGDRGWGGERLDKNNIEPFPHSLSQINV